MCLSSFERRAAACTPAMQHAHLLRNRVSTFKTNYKIKQNQMKLNPEKEFYFEALLQFGL